MRQASTFGSITLGDGLDVLTRELSVKQIARLIERTARWVAPETFALLPLWYPEYARNSFFYKKGWSEPRHNTSRATGLSAHKQEGNGYANNALCLALGLKKQQRPNWSCCHIWGRDDPTYQHANTVIADNRFYSCVGNMLLLPTPLKAFTDAVPEIKTMLRVCASHLYGWSCDHPDIGHNRDTILGFADWQSYPRSWPRSSKCPRPRGVMPLNDTIRLNASKRLRQIRSDMELAGPHYPREAVRHALAYWKIVL